MIECIVEMLVENDPIPKVVQELVRCKDCRDYMDIKCPCYELDKDENWFCADGVKRDE